MISKIRGLLLSFFGFLAFLFLFKSYPTPTEEVMSHFPGQGESYARVAKVSMLYGDYNQLYERAIRTHRLHDERQRYPMHVLRHETMGGFWNKPSYLLSLIVSELAKPAHQRVEWFMWVDADLILINPSVPLEVFLPPHDFQHIHFLGNRDQNGLNTGTFFIHVHEWSVKMLVKAMGYPMFLPDVDLGNSMDQVAMAHVFNDTDFRDGVMFQPRVWYNTYEWHHAYEGEKGYLLVHFPGLEEDRWKHMSDWLRVVENDPDEWDVPLSQTHYPNVTSRFWQNVRDAVTILNRAEKAVNEHGPEVMGISGMADAITGLKEQVLFAADEVHVVKEKTAVLEGKVAEFDNLPKGPPPPQAPT